MALTTKTHWLGVLLLFSASILLLITTISAPIINHAGLLRVTLANSTAREHSALNFGTFGYCVLGVPPIETQQSWCTGRHIGYDPSDVVTRATGATFETTSGGTANSLTRIMVLHPIACGLAFIAFLSTLGGRTISSALSGTLVTLITWVLVLVSLIIDFTAFGIIKHEVNEQFEAALPTAKFGTAMWCLVASFILLSAAVVVVAGSVFGAFRERRAKRKSATEGQATAGNTGTQTRKKRFGIF